MLACLAALTVLKPVPLHVEKNQLVEDGKPVVLRGVEIPGFESSDGPYVFRSARIAFEDWHANCIRIPVSQDRWFGRAERQTDKGEGYRNAVEEVINLALNRGRYIIVSLQSSDGGQWGGIQGPHAMPDANSLSFWKDLAVKYRSEPHVLFGLYRAPHDIGWPVWRDGGAVKENEQSYQAVGMQTLLDALRKSGAKNVCLIDPPEGAKDLTGFAGPAALTDVAGRGFLAELDISPIKGDDQAMMAEGNARIPLLVSLGRDLQPESATEALMVVLKAWNIPWIAKEFSPESKPNLISDWLYTPTTPWGSLIKQALAGG